ncbi:MAG: bifunctional metallophosphatase/5'-nucleotidase [Acidobacteria bacterium]|nr:bifunctional metallophosphatase/5'-nucleotidase [Acidobacteriota bacterium]
MRQILSTTKRSSSRPDRVVPVLLVALLACACLHAGIAGAATVTVLFVNDTHAHLDAVGPRDAALTGTVGGIARAATVIARERGADPAALVLHAGDFFQGDLFFNAYFGVPELRLLAAAGVDAIAVGNHEFDLGPEVLAGALSEAFPNAEVPLLSANLDLSGFPVLSAFISPSMIREVAGVKVGIFGMTVPDDPLMRPDPVQVLGAGDPEVLLGLAGAEVSGLRAAGAQVVICLSHLGYAYDRALAETVPGVDIVVGGHDHLELSEPVQVDNPSGGTTLIVSAGSHYRYVGRLRVDAGPDGVRLLDYALLPLDAGVPPAPEVQAVVEQLKSGIVARWGDVYGTEVARARRPIAKDWDRGIFRDSPMGNLVTDALRLRTGADIAITANGLISEGLPEGPLVAADVFRTVSYGYDLETGLGLRVATFDITGAELVHGLEATLAFLGISRDFFLEVSGMRFSYDPEEPVGSRVAHSSVRIGHERLSLSRTYSVAVNTGIVVLLPMLGVEVSNVQLLPILEYDAVLDHVRTLRTLDARSEGRIRELDRLPGPHRARKSLIDPDPLP